MFVKNDRKNISPHTAAHISWHLYLSKPYRKGPCRPADTVTGRPGHIIDHTVYSLYPADDLVGLLGIRLSFYGHDIFFLLVLILAAVAVFHKMVLKEERYLLGVHGGEYEEYKNQTGRYWPPGIAG